MNYILWVMPIVFTTMCCATFIKDSKQENYVQEWIDKERKLGISPFSPTIQPHDPFQKKEISPEIVSKVDKQTLSSKIKSIVYQVFFQEMAIKSGDFSDIAQGNAELAKDLKELFCVSFNSDNEIAQEKLDEFCHKWGLEKIEISEAHTF